MGKYFTWSEIEAGKIPRFNDFKNMREKISQFFLEADCIKGAMFYGSIVNNDYDIRSDINCLVIYHNQDRPEVFKLLTKLNDIADIINVPLEFVPINLDLVKLVKPVDSLLAQTLNHFANRDNIIKGRPLSFLPPEKQDMNDDLQIFFRNKLYLLKKNIFRINSMKEADRAWFLQKIMEMPFRIAKNMLTVYFWPAGHMSKEKTVQEYKRFFSQELYKRFEYLVSIDRSYKELIMMKPNSDNYYSFELHLFSDLRFYQDFLIKNIIFAAQKSKIKLRNI